MTIQNSELQKLSTYQDRLTGLLPPTIESADTISPIGFLTKISGTVSIATIKPVTDGAHLICLIFTDVTPGTFSTTGNIGSAVTPLQNNLVFLMFDPLLNKYYPSAISAAVPPSPNSQTSFLVSGGVVVWLEDYIFLVSAATYFINGVLFNSPETQITLDAAHATLDRLDVIAVTSSETVVKITGVAAAQPSEPDIDPGSQLKLGLVLVTANTTEPVGITDELIYADDAGEPTEWDWTETGTGFDVSSLNQPIPPNTHSIEGTNVPAGDFAQGENAETIESGIYDTLILYIKSKATWGNNRGLQLSWRLSGVTVGLTVPIQRTGTFGFVSSNTTSYQLVAIPMNLFGLSPTTEVDELRITGFGGPIGMYIGNISLQLGAVSQAPGGLTLAEADARYRRISEVVEIDLGTVGATETIDLAGKMAANYLLTLDENLTLTLTNPSVGGHYMFIFKQDGTGTNTVTFSPVPLWSEGVAPVITPDANAVSLVTLAFSAVNGGKYLGAANLANA